MLTPKFRTLAAAGTLAAVALTTISSRIAAQGDTTFTARPRLILTPEKRVALFAKKNANHPNYAALKTYVDSQTPAWVTNMTPLAANINATASTITVVEGGRFSAGELLVRIGTELISCASRSGNTLSGCSRGATPSDFGIATTAVSHVAGEAVWQHKPGSDFVNLTPMAALLVQLQTPGYDVKARGLLSILAMYTMAGKLYQNGNYVRWYVPGLALGYDWNYANLTVHEKSLYTEALRLIARDHLTNTYCGQCAKETYAVNVVGRPTAIQTSLYGNIANGELQAVLMASAAIAGDSPDAAAHWAGAMNKINQWLLPAIADGVAADGNSPEGSEYSSESYLQTLNMFRIIESATRSVANRAVVEDYAAAVAKFLIYSTLPGTVKSSRFVNGSVPQGSSTLTVDAVADFQIGQPVRIALDSAPWVMETAIIGISGNTFKLRDTAIARATNKRVTHIYRELAWGDATENPASSYLDSLVTDGHIATGYQIVDVLKHSNPEVAGYVRYWLDNVVNDAGVGLWGKFMRFVYDEPSVPARDYREMLPTMWGTTRPGYGMLIGRSDWGATATLVHFLGGGEMYDHTHSDFNSYQIRRGGTWLSRELPGYDIRPFPGIFNPKVAEAKYMGARYHNTVLMNGHGGNNGRIMATEKTTPAMMSRSEISDTMMYARGDASGQYASNHWVNAGYANNHARTFVRDFMYVKPNLIVFSDTLLYSAATLSPTTWIARFAGNPEIIGQRFTSIYGGQKIVHDVVAPEKARFTKVNELAENSDLDDFHTQPHFRIETTSGVTTEAERSMQIIQVMDPSTPPIRISSLTKVNADVAQAGDYVLGAVHAGRAGFPISYAYVGRPKHYLMGFEPSTDYYVVDSGSTITIRMGAGSGNRMSSPAGLLILGETRDSLSTRVTQATPPVPSTGPRR